MRTVSWYGHPLDLTKPESQRDHPCASRPMANSRGLAGVIKALGWRTEQAPLEWVPVNSRLCAVRLNGFGRMRTHVVAFSSFLPTLLLTASRMK
ncbi:unnamed protein product [Schistosoma curassoni]|uniref:Type II toxin-antitoxin system HicA family toxin n=1 Tax=Schistosoma curassoni TaxID=6186 RepID=A0A183L6S9_9TREM|nr:unnamed protein product [Schistosoma curassoni]